MRTTYLLDHVRRSAAGAARGLAGLKEQQTQRRRRLWAAGVAGLAVVAAVLWGWHLAFPPPALPATPASASVPEHQLSGPLANPWGSGPAVVGEPTAERPEAHASSAALAAASSAAAAALAVREAVAALATPAGRDAVRAALARLRASARASDFVKAALQAPPGQADAPALVAAWMAERQCRGLAQWKLVMEWRARALQPGMRIEPGANQALPGTPPAMRRMMDRCAEMPPEAALEAALAAAGFAATDLPEPTRRPLDLTLAASIDDPALLAAVVDATPLEDLIQWVAARTAVRGSASVAAETSPEILRAAMWLASCRAGGDAAHAAVRRQVCAEHPEVWQSCVQSGLCDGRDLHDVLLRSLPTESWHASQRLAQAIGSQLGR